MTNKSTYLEGYLSGKFLTNALKAFELAKDINEEQFNKNIEIAYTMIFTGIDDETLLSIALLKDLDIEFLRSYGFDCSITDAVKLLIRYQSFNDEMYYNKLKLSHSAALVKLIEEYNKLFVLTDDKKIKFVHLYNNYIKNIIFDTKIFFPMYRNQIYLIDQTMLLVKTEGENNENKLSTL